MRVVNMIPHWMHDSWYHDMARDIRIRNKRMVEYLRTHEIQPVAVYNGAREIVVFDAMRNEYSLPVRSDTVTKIPGVFYEMRKL